MSNYNASKVCEWASYLLIVAATVVFFAMHKNVQLTLLLVVIAVYCRAIMYRYRYRASQEENEELRKDLQQATALLKQRENRGQN